MKAKLTTRNLELALPGLKSYDIRDTDLSGFLLRVHPSGERAYFCDYRRPDGRRTRVKIGDVNVLTPAQARDEAKKILGDLARGQDPAAVRKAAHQDTLGVFLEKRYRPWVEAHRKTGVQTVSRTLSCFQEFKNQSLAEISPWKIEKWRSAQLKAGKTASTVNRNVTMLKSVLSKAVEWEMIDIHPFAKVKPLRVDTFAKVRFLSQEEEVALRNALNDRESHIREERRSHNAWCAERGYKSYPDLDERVFADYLKPMTLIAINTGMRQGELFNLSWDDIDFNRRMLTVVGDTAKSGKTRHIPLNNEALHTLQAWKSQSDVTTALVFGNANGARFNNIRKSWMTLLAHAKINNFRWHDLRHHFASALVMRGVDLNTVRELLGHGDIKMTLRYAHLAPRVKADAVARLDIDRETSVGNGSTIKMASVI